MKPKVTPSEGQDSSSSCKPVDSSDPLTIPVRMQTPDEPLNEADAAFEGKLSAEVESDDNGEEKEESARDERPSKEPLPSMQSTETLSDQPVLKRKADMIRTRGKKARGQDAKPAALGSKVKPSLKQTASKATNADEKTKGEESNKKKNEPKKQEIAEDTKLSDRVKSYLTDVVVLARSFKRQEEICSDIGLKTSSGILLVGEPEDHKTQFDGLVEKFLQESGLFCRSVNAARLNDKTVDDLLLEVFEASTAGFVLIKKIDSLSDKTAPAVVHFLSRIEDARLPVVTIGTTTDLANVTNGIGACFVKRPVSVRPAGVSTSFIRSF